MDFSWKYLLVTFNYITQGSSEIQKYKPLISYNIPTNHQTNMQYALREVFQTKKRGNLGNGVGTFLNLGLFGMSS